MDENKIEALIHIIRGQRVMLSTDLARLYGVAPKTLVQAVKRNITRFPDDFAFLIDWQDIARSRSQFVTLNRGENVKYRPYAFTEQGVAMLSSVLRSERAVQVNIETLFETIRQLMRPPEPPRKQIGFVAGGSKSALASGART